MKVDFDVADEVLAEAIARIASSSLKVSVLVDEALRRLGPSIDAIILRVATPLIEARVERVINEIVVNRAKRMTQKGEPLKAVVDDAVRRRVEQLKMGV